MSTLPPDPWKVLGVEKNVDKTEVRKAYRKLVLSCHPDKVQDPTLRAQKQDEFQKVQQAYELLNDDAERAKYEEQVKLHELRRQQAQVASLSKNMPNISVSRASPQSSTTYREFDIKMASPRSSRPSPTHNTSQTKIYTQYATRTRSSEDVDYRSPDDEYRRRRDRETSYEKPSRREEEMRESRRRDDKRENRREEEERASIERERDRIDKEARRQARKASERDRSEKKKRDVEDKSRKKMPYVEVMPHDDDYPIGHAKVEKKKLSSSGSSSKKHDEPRDKSSTRRERAESPAALEKSDKTDLLKEAAASYIEKQRSKAKAAPLTRAATFHEVPNQYPPPVVPPPPALDDHVDDDAPRRSSARNLMHRRPSDPHDLPRRSKEKAVYQASHKSREAVDSPPSPPKERGGPSTPLSKRAYTMPTGEVEPSPRYRETPTRRMAPQMVKSSTWASSSGGTVPEAFVQYTSDTERHEEPSRRHRNRREPSEEIRREPVRRQTSYRVGADHRAAKVEPLYDEPYEYDDRRGSGRRHREYDPYDDEYSGSRRVETRDTDYYYDPHIPFKVKMAKEIKPDNVQYASYRPIYTQS